MQEIQERHITLVGWVCGVKMKIKTYLLTAVLGLSALAGCAASSTGTQHQGIEEDNLRKFRRLREQGIMKKLGLKSPVDILYLGEGYATSIHSEATLRNIAGILSGDLRVKKVPNGYVVEGNLMGQIPIISDPFVLEALVGADWDFDRILTQKELLKYTHDVLERYAR